MPEGRPLKQPKKDPHDEEIHLEHVHIFQTLADVADDHQHLITGISGTPIAKGRSHVHRLCVITSYDPKEGCVHPHWHNVDIMTGPAVEVGCCDEHTHPFQGNTSEVLCHCHEFCSVTDSSVEYDMDCEEEEIEPDCTCKPCKWQRPYVE
ncbi:hypothetical protein AXX12_04925 [Anaerosporomusa subterranea]|uniref:YmaF family protein n=1 Tax=Anaerosporomusa subterranea TaxID=1794912 RepID=A0A154BU82_ANASB|nr:YmaF family protein [Anaerosporomusa subterranea]KYZ77457.1 hypothetical protein AXX12_04925 [Anaerosporomusa subterranea]